MNVQLREHAESIARYAIGSVLLDTLVQTILKKTTFRRVILVAVGKVAW